MNKDSCNRCGTHTFFTDSYFKKKDKLCRHCSRNEENLKKRLSNNGLDYKHCGYIPIKHSIK
jgi:hypothetical protein